ncbi:hypothetical protein [Streptomyces wuyuanensis]|nr:hypothetical protein [Streptomyces wuyuanensis]
MNADASRRPRMQQVATTGSALATALLPLMVGILVAKSLGADPMTPVNALIAGGGQRPRVCPAQLRSCGRGALRRRRPGPAPAAESGPRSGHVRVLRRVRSGGKLRSWGRPEAWAGTVAREAGMGDGSRRTATAVS